MPPGPLARHREARTCRRIQRCARRVSAASGARPRRYATRAASSAAAIVEWIDIRMIYPLYVTARGGKRTPTAVSRPARGERSKQCGPSPPLPAPACRGRRIAYEPATTHTATSSLFKTSILGGALALGLAVVGAGLGQTGGAALLSTTQAAPAIAAQQVIVHTKQATDNFAGARLADARQPLALRWRTRARSDRPDGGARADWRGERLPGHAADRRGPGPGCRRSHGLAWPDSGGQRGKQR